MSLIVQKFGGTSVSDTHHLYNVAKKAISFYRQGHDVIVVVSAQGDTTDVLVKKAREITSCPNKREFDALLATGEQISASLLAMVIESLGISAISLTGWQAGFNTNSSYTEAKILGIDVKRVNEEIKNKKIVVITGFQGIDENSNITTLGRGGSDTSAVAIAASMNASVCKIYTDVDGVYTADPRIVSSARKLDSLSYEEMLKLSSLGSQVLSERSIQTAEKFGVEVEVLSSMKNDAKGTIIKNISKSEVESISGIAVEKSMVKVIVSNFEEYKISKKDIFSFLFEKGLLKDKNLVPTGQVLKNSLYFLVKEDYLDETVESLKCYLKDFKNIEIFYEKNKSKVSVVNISQSLNVNIASIVFETLHGSNIDIEMTVCDSNRISVVIDEESLYRCVNDIHNKLFEEDYLDCM